MDKTAAVAPMPPKSTPSPHRAMIRRVATEELTRIKSEQPDQYRALKATFLSSLDESARRVFAEVQARLEPKVFDEHLRQRLVKFMVDHPAAWKASGSPASARTESAEVH